MGYWLVWPIALVLAVVSIGIAFGVSKGGDYDWLHWVVILGWTLGPPSWFLADAGFRSQPNGRGVLTPVEKQLYDASAKFWAAVLAAMTAIYLADKWHLVS